MTACEWLSGWNKRKEFSTPYWIGPTLINRMNDIDHTSRPIRCKHLKQVFSIKSLAFKNNFQFVEHRGSVGMCRRNQENRYWCMQQPLEGTPLARCQLWSLSCSASLPTYAYMSVSAVINLSKARDLTFLRNNEFIFFNVRWFTFYRLYGFGICTNSSGSHLNFVKSFLRLII